MKHGIAVIITSLSVQVAAEPQWTFMDESAARGGAYDVRADKVRVVVPDKPFEPGHLASVLTLPLPDGTTVQFDVHPNALLPDALALRYPSINTYNGKAIDQATDTGRFDVLPVFFEFFVGIVFALGRFDESKINALIFKRAPVDISLIGRYIDSLDNIGVIDLIRMNDCGDPPYNQKEQQNTARNQCDQKLFFCQPACKINDRIRSFIRHLFLCVN